MHFSVHYLCWKQSLSWFSPNCRVCGLQLIKFGRPAPREGSVVISVIVYMHLYPQVRQRTRQSTQQHLNSISFSIRPHLRRQAMTTSPPITETKSSRSRQLRLCESFILQSKTCKTILRKTVEIMWMFWHSIKIAWVKCQWYDTLLLLRRAWHQWLKWFCGIIYLLIYLLKWQLTLIIIALTLLAVRQEGHWCFKSRVLACWSPWSDCRLQLYMF